MTCRDVGLFLITCDSVWQSREDLLLQDIIVYALACCWTFNAWVKCLQGLGGTSRGDVKDHRTMSLSSYTISC